jgi:hypothetical protein
MTHLDRYKAGDHKAVWDELIKLGPAALVGPLATQTASITAEIVRRAQTNLELLVARLEQMGFRFRRGLAPLQLVHDIDSQSKRIRAVEDLMGQLPRVVQYWYNTFESVDLRQADEQLYCSANEEKSPAPSYFGLGSHPVLVFENLVKCQEHRRAIAKRSVDEEVPELGKEAVDDYYRQFLPLGGYNSAGQPKGFRLPVPAVDGVFYNEGFGDVSFVDELRMAFEWGGFPFWRRLLSFADFYAPYEFRPAFAELLPILKEGLLEF